MNNISMKVMKTPRSGVSGLVDDEVEVFLMVMRLVASTQVSSVLT